MNGTEIPAWLQDRHGRGRRRRRGHPPLGVEVATELVEQLLDLGVPGIHLYALNRANSIQEIYDNLGLAEP